MQEPLPTTPTDYAAILQRALTVGATLTERLLDLPDDSARNPAADYHLINRAMRQAILVLHKITAQPEAQTNIPRPEIRVAARKRIIREVEDAIQYRAGHQADQLRAELLERLDDASLDADLAARPLPDIIADICRDFRIVSPMESGQFARRTPDDLTALCALAARLPGQLPPATLPKRPKPPPPDRRVGETHHRQPVSQPIEPPRPDYAKLDIPRFPQRRAPLSTPSLMIDVGDDHPERPEAHIRDQR